MRLNGTTFLARDLRPASPTAGIPTWISVATVYQLAANDYLELVVNQNSGGALDVETDIATSPEFGVVRIA